MAKTAFIGLGVMGFPMAGHLKAKGHEVTVFNRNTARAQSWVEKHGGKTAKTPAEAARGAEFVFICVGNDADVRAVADGNDGALAGMAKVAVRGLGVRGCPMAGHLATRGGHDLTVYNRSAAKAEA